MKKLIFQKIIYPILHSAEPVHEVALGVGIGVFFALTPTVGIQTVLIMLAGLILALFRIYFSPIISLAMVWISNPLTIGPMYYLFWITGHFFFSLIGYKDNPISYELFIQTVDKIVHTSGFIATIREGFSFFVIRLGFSMMIGSFFYAIPFAILGYFVVAYFLRRHRKHKAQKEGISYEEWKKEHEKSIADWAHLKKRNAKRKE